MSEVYLAKDLRLSRLVAIKLLPSDLTAKPKLRERFQVEARAISALSHPNICRLYDVGHAGSIEFLVLEYLEGETLSDRLDRGSLPLDECLRISIQIAEASTTRTPSVYCIGTLSPQISCSPRMGQC
jgi:serine/threonine protein kinase